MCPFGGICIAKCAKHLGTAWSDDSKKQTRIKKKIRGSKKQQNRDQTHNKETTSSEEDTEKKLCGIRKRQRDEINKWTQRQSKETEKRIFCLEGGWIPTSMKSGVRGEQRKRKSINNRKKE